MKVGDNVRLLDSDKFNGQHIGKVFTVTLNAGDMFELMNSEGYMQHYYPSWGTDCYEIVNITPVNGCPCVGGCGQDAWTVDNYCTDISGGCPGPENNPQQSARYNSGKVQLREIDPDFITGLGEVLTASRAKYEEGNWMNETKFSTPYESCMRHLMKFWNGEEFDDETSKHHLLHAATNLMFLYYHTNSGKGIDDRLFKKKGK